MRRKKIKEGMNGKLCNKLMNVYEEGKQRKGEKKTFFSYSKWDLIK